MANYKLVNADQLDSDLTAVGNAIRSKGGTSAGLSFPAGMVSAIGAISTGVELNFDVVPGMTQPGTAAENTIWVETEKIGAWHFSATQPDGMVDYDVWFSVGTYSTVEFNALKKGGIQVYPLSAKQMISGALVDKIAKSYLSGKWVEWIPKDSLYYKGNEITHITGGWKQTSFKSSKLGTVTKNSESIALDGSNSTTAFLVTEDKIDLTDYTTIKLNALTCVGNSSYGVPAFFVVDKNDNPGDENQILRQQMETGAGVKNANIEGVNGLYYVAINVGSWASGTVKLEFDHVWLE